MKLAIQSYIIEAETDKMAIQVIQSYIIEAETDKM